MRVRNAVWLVVLLIGVCPLLRADCNDVVWDQQHVLSNSDEQMLQQAAQGLKTVGADIHALTVNMGNASSLEAAVNTTQASCASWQANGQRKNNLLVFAVDTQRHKSGIFYGSLYHRLDLGWRDVAAQYMNPHFRDREWAAGLAEGMRQTRVLLAETPGAGKTVVQHFEPATDYTPFWHILGWIVFGLFLVLSLWLTRKLFNAQALRKQKLADAQAELQQAKSNATNDLDKAKQKLAEDAATGVMITPHRQGILDRAYMTFSRIAAVEDRSTSINFLSSIASQYRAVSDNAQQCMEVIPPEPIRRVPRWKPNVPPNIAPTVTSPAPAPAPVSSTTVIHDGGDSGLLTGVLLGDMMSRPDVEDARPLRRRDDEDDRPSHHSSSSDDSPSYSSDSGGGGGSDWGSSDSGGGGGSDFGSSDSGGGGSTDF